MSRLRTVEVGSTISYKGEIKTIVSKDVIITNIMYNVLKDFISVSASDSHGKQLSMVFFSGDINVYRNNVSELMLSEISVGDSVRLYGWEYDYQGHHQFSCYGGYELLPDKIELSTANSIDFGVEILKLFDYITDSNLKSFCNEVFISFKSDLSSRPAARTHHHNYVGGLLQHTYEVMINAISIARHYKVDLDVIIASAFFHDIMKIYEYSDLGEYQPDGSNFGHIYMGAEFFKTNASSKNINKETTNKIVHCILSHHGQLEWGSPVAPNSQEAAIVFCADLCSARMNALRDVSIGNDYYNKMG